ncbi:hypothetical protein [Mesorhizobium argentiipisi]|uniref:Uncharacterized protein n=1 Tax=Mesorhizobium argentiipisi TaxID=3015175 RepID=A0ABU8KML8_9HYPH
MAIMLKNMAVSLKTRPVVANKCGNETAGANQRLSSEQARACFVADCQQLAGLFNTKPPRPLAGVCERGREILVLFSGDRRKYREVTDAATKRRPADP